MKRFLALLAVPAMLVGVWGTGYAMEDNQVKLGEDLVEHLGCLYCHGLGGKKGIDNPNAKRRYVPAWDEKEFIERYPVADGVRYVITNGRFPEKARGATSSPIPMPPWGNRLSEDEMDAIVAYIWSLRETPTSSHAKGGRGSIPTPDDKAIAARQAMLTANGDEAADDTAGQMVPAGPPGSPVALGQGLVEHLGCLYCHGLGGRQGIDNPNAERKYIPAWDEKEFIERYPVDAGVRSVITNGRFPDKARGAKGSPIPMPPWGNRLSKEEMDAIIAYIWSLRETPVESHDKGGRGGVH